MCLQNGNEPLLTIWQWLEIYPEGLLPSTYTSTSKPLAESLLLGKKAQENISKQLGITRSVLAVGPDYSYLPTGNFTLFLANENDLRAEERASATIPKG